MLHARLRITFLNTVCGFWKCSTNPYAAIVTRNLATTSLDKYIERINNTDPSDLRALWDGISLQDRATALNLRNHFYSKLRQSLLSSPDAVWALAILNSIPMRTTRYADYLFAVDLLILQKDWSALNKLLVQLATYFPSFWEELFARTITSTGQELSVKDSLACLLSSCVAMKIDLAQLSRALNSPIVDSMQIILSKYDSRAIITALESLAATNAVQASALASGLLRAIGESVVDSQPPPTVTEMASKTEAVIESNGTELPVRLWSWKISRESVTTEDLKIYMMLLIYNRRPKQALDVYDRMSELQSIALNEAVLLAASAVGDFERLQLEFERVEQNPKLIEELGSRRYSIVLQALGYVGNANVLDSIYQNMSTWHGNLRSRGVFHALIYSHSLRGDLKSSMKAYELMTKANISPTSSTFSLLFSAFRDAQDLPGFIAFLGDEVLTKYQFPLTNRDLSLALSLCAKRRDFKSAEYIWKWGTSLLKPDARTYNAYLYCFLVTNQFDMVWKIFDVIEKNGTVGIDTLTMLMSAAGRHPNTTVYVQEILKRQKNLRLAPDERWYLAYLSVLEELGNLSKFEAVFSEMKSHGITAHASHYAIYTEFLAKSKSFANHEQLSIAMKNAHIPINFAFIEKHLRLLSASGTTPDARMACVKAAFALIKEGHFDPWSSMVPRGAIPVRVIEPVVRLLLKTKQAEIARKLLDGLQRQRLSESHVTDDYMLWGLYLEVSEATNNEAAIDSLWDRFVASLKSVSVLNKPRDLIEEETGLDGGPQFKIPRRYRYTFAKPVEIRIHNLRKSGEGAKLRALDEELQSLGIEMNNHTLNAYILSLLYLKESKPAFDKAYAAQQTRFYRMSQAVAYAMKRQGNRVDLTAYGKLGEYIRRRLEFGT